MHANAGIHVSAGSANGKTGRPGFRRHCGGREPHNTHRADTTKGPWKGPAGTVSIDVRYIGTVQSQVMWRSSIPQSTSASSKENEQPIAKATRSSRHQPLMSVGSSTT